MSNFAILGVTGDAKVWLVDFENKTVESVDAETAQRLAGSVQDRNSGAVMKGIDFAVMASNRSDAASQGLTQA